MPACARPTAGFKSLLGNPGPLSLRICGGEHDGRLISIRSAKCTIGSAPGCTLRLRASGVAPLHCWILRGDRGTVIRRLHSHASLNGGGFEEAYLAAGDHLRVGSVDLEIVDCNAANAEDAVPLFSPPVKTSQRMDERLERALEEVARLEDESRQGWQASIMAAERADQLRDAVTSAQQQLAEVGDELACCRETIAAQTTEIDKLRREVSEARGKLDQADRVAAMTVPLPSQAQRSHDSDSIARRIELQQQLSESQQKLAAAELALREAQSAQREAGERDQPSAERLRSLEQQRKAEQEELARLRSQTAERSRLEARVESLTQQLDLQSRALTEAQENAASAQAALASQAAAPPAALDQQQKSDSEELASLRSQAAERTRLKARVESLTQQLDLQSRALTEAQENAASAQAALESQAASQQASSDQQQSALAAREADLVRQEQSLQEALAHLTTQRESCDRDQTRLASDRDALAQLQQDLLAAQEQLHRERQEFEVQCQRPADSHLPSASIDQGSDARAEDERKEFVDRGQTVVLGSQGATPAAAVTAPWQSDEDHGAIPSEEAGASSATPIENSSKAEDVTGSSSVNSVLSRLVNAGVWRKPEDSKPEPQSSSPPVEAESPPPCEETVAPTPAAESSVVSQPPANDIAPEDDSIENYMDRLLKRVRGESPSAAGAWKKPASAEHAPAPEPAPVAAPEPVVEAPPAAIAEEPYVPRSKAPELTSDLSAMRELANSAARSAIDRHIRTHSGQQAAGKLFGAFLTVGASAVLAYWAWKTQSLVAGVGACLGGAVGAYWTLGAFRRMLTVRRLNRQMPVQTKVNAATGSKSASQTDIVKVS